MKTFLAALAAAALFAGIATQIHTLSSGHPIALLALCFAAALATAGVAVRVAGRTSRRPAEEAASATDAKPKASRRRPASAAAPAESAASTNAEREVGTVKWFDRSKGYGFIIRDNADEIFVHHRSIRRDGAGRPALDDGQPVSFVAVERQRGWQAEDVVAE